MRVTAAPGELRHYGSGLGSPGGTLIPTLYRVVGELAPEPGTDPLELPDAPLGTSSPVFLPMPPHPAGTISPDISPYPIATGTSDCIRRLAADRAERIADDQARAAELANLQAAGRDPLEL